MSIDVWTSAADHQAVYVSPDWLSQSDCPRTGRSKDFRSSAEYFQPELRNYFQPPKMESILRLSRTCRDKKKNNF